MIDRTNVSSSANRNAAGFVVSISLYLTMGILINEIFFAGLEPKWFVRWAVLPILIWFSAKSYIVVLFGLAIASLLSQSDNRELPFQMGGQWVRILGMLLLIYVSSHFQAIRVGLVEAWLSLQDSLDIPIDTLKSSDRSRTDKTWVSLVWSSLTVVLKSLCAMLFAWLLLLYQPWTSTASPWLSWSRTNRQILWPGPTLIVLIVGIGIVLHEWAWRHKSLKEWKMYMRTVALVANYPDLRRIAKATMKSKSHERPGLKGDPSP